MYVLLLVSLAFLTKTSVDGASVIQNSKYWIRKNAKFKQAFVMDWYKTRSVTSCLSDCSTRDGCLSVSWSSEEKYCLLSNIDQTNDEPYNTPTQIEEATGWNTMTVIRYPVTHVLGDNGRYTLTFEEAKSKCLERGMEIAAPEDLLAAKSMGYELCSWSWLSEGSVGLVLQQQTSGCTSWYDEGIIYCTWCGLADVWCKFR